ncbi:MAG: alpha/beta hydrolase [Actinomycetota bacterium]|nr:alpha/beta hydrolase [Actinomycetota bacterium]
MNTVASDDGTSIAYDVLGDGPAVIIVGGATCTRGVTAPLAAALGEHCRVINYDRRGRGDSEDRSVHPPFLVEREIEDLAALIKAHGGRAAIYGHSSGAALALHATLGGIGVDRLVMHDAPYNLPGSEQHGRDWDARLHEMLAAGRPGDAVAAFLQIVGMPDEMIDGIRQSPMWPGMEAVGPSLAYDSAAMGDSSGGTVPVDLLARVDVPALVLVGGDDYGFMIDVAKQLADGIPDGRMEHMVGAAHDVGPEVVVPRLAPFLSA